MCYFCLACAVRCGVHQAFFRTWRHMCSVRVEGCFDTIDHQKQAEPKKNGHPNPLRFLARYSACCAPTFRHEQARAQTSIGNVTWPGIQKDCFDFYAGLRARISAVRANPRQRACACARILVKGCVKVVCMGKLDCDCT